MTLKPFRRKMTARPSRAIALSSTTTMVITGPGAVAIGDPHQPPGGTTVTRLADRRAAGRLGMRVEVILGKWFRAAVPQPQSCRFRADPRPYYFGENS